MGGDIKEVKIFTSSIFYSVYNFTSCIIDVQPWEVNICLLCVKNKEAAILHNPDLTSLFPTLLLMLMPIQITTSQNMDSFLNYTAILVSIQALQVVSAVSLQSNIVDGDDTSTPSICIIPCNVIQEAIIEEVEKFYMIQSLSSVLRICKRGHMIIGQENDKDEAVMRMWKMVSYDREKAYKCEMSDWLGTVP